MSDFKAGTWELTAVLWDEILSKPGEPFNFKRHRRGDRITLDSEQAERLGRAGAVVKPGERERAAAAAAKAQYEAAMAALPAETEPVEPEPSTAPEGDGTPEPARPNGRGSRR